MSSVGSGYDLGVTTFSQDGRVFQVEYASKCISSQSLLCGLVCKDGLVLASEIWLNNALTVPTSGTRLFLLDEHVVCAVAGLRSDGLHLIKMARNECASHRKLWGSLIPGNVLAKRIGQYMHWNTCSWSSRSYGVSILLGVMEPHAIPAMPGSITVEQSISSTKRQNTIEVEKPRNSCNLWLIDNSGAIFKYFGTAQGTGAPGAKTDIEKLDWKNLSVQEAKISLSRILVKHHEANVPKKPYRLEFLAINGDEQIELSEPAICSELTNDAKRWLEAQPE